MRYVRVGSSRSGSLDLWRICTGVRGCLLLPLPVELVVVAAASSFVEGEGIASGVAVVWRVDLGLFYGALRRRAMVLGQVGVGCVPGRWTSTGDFFLFLETGFCCGSFQSQSEMALFLACGWCRSSPCSVVGSGEGARRCVVTSASTTTSLVDFFCFSRGVRAVWLGHLSLLYPSSTCLYSYALVLVSP